ncbi:hypothetical protein C0Q97_06755 [Streptomyces albidoflavus]|uniref:Uncharacterized protein n=1 Tax=Streptomyces albidoflavus TaxID=1886 RepID=A0AA37FBV1_9ACTN|nr:hypothetical protein C0Q97_06755 [Streptomyces albidoflavus]GHI45304.1 hypothetical protein ScoT_14780 [Streptomyces albidoflavus]
MGLQVGQGGRQGAEGLGAQLELGQGSEVRLTVRGSAPMWPRLRQGAGRPAGTVRAPYVACYLRFARRGDGATGRRGDGATGHSAGPW